MRDTPIQSDQDTTGSGESFLPLFRAPAASGFHHERGKIEHPAIADADFYFSVAQKRSHSRGVYTGAVSGVRQADFDLDVADLLPIAVASNANHTSAGVAPPRQDDGSEDPYDFHLRRNARPNHVTVSGGVSSIPSVAGLMSVDMSFGVDGAATTDAVQSAGTYLGYDESVLAKGGDIYVGSADGYVTMFRNNSGLNGALDPLAQTEESLGYGVWALVDDAGSSGNDIMAFTYGHVHFLSASTLVRTGASIPLSTKYIRPRRARRADVFPSLAGDEVAFVTFSGYIVVMDLVGNILASYYEPGIQDFQVGGNATSGYSNQILCLSERGVVGAIRLQLATDEYTHLAELDFWSDVYGEWPEDLDWDVNGGLVALYRAAGPGGQHFVVRRFDGSNLDLIAEANIVSAPGYPSGFEVVSLANGTYVVMANGELVHLGSALNVITRFGLDDFAPSVHACGLAIGNPDGGAEDVVVGTAAGYVVYFEAPVGGLQAIASTQPPGFRSSRTLSATWGICESGGVLEVVDQAGVRGQVDLSGAYTYVGEQRASHVFTPPGQELKAGPIRGLSPVPSVPNTTSGNQWATISQSSPSLGLIIGNPYAPEQPFDQGPVYQSWTMIPHQQAVVNGWTAWAYGGAHDRLQLSGTNGTGLAWMTGFAPLNSTAYRNLMFVAEDWGPVGSLAFNLWSSASYTDPNADWGKVGTGIPGPGTLQKGHRLVGSVDWRSSFANSGCDIQSLWLDRGRVYFGSPGGDVMQCSTRTGDPGVDAESVTNIGAPTSPGYDTGFGIAGMAMGAPPNGAANGYTGLYFATMFSHTLSTRYQNMGSVADRMAWHYSAYDVDDATGTTTVALRINVPVENGTGGLFAGSFAPAAVAVGDLGQGPRVFIGTLGGDVFMVCPTTMYCFDKIRLPGAVGAWSGMVVADLDGVGGDELYVAGSRGIWKIH